KFWCTFCKFRFINIRINQLVFRITIYLTCIARFKIFYYSFFIKRHIWFSCDRNSFLFVYFSFLRNSSGVIFGKHVILLSALTLYTLILFLLSWAVVETKRSFKFDKFPQDSVS